MNVHFSSQSNEWATPQDFFDTLASEFPFTLDPCATHENHKCEKYFTLEDDGLSKSWDNEIVFCNPPYGRGIKEWVKKAALSRGGGCRFTDTGANRHNLLSRMDLSQIRDQIYQRTAQVRRTFQLRSLSFDGRCV